MSRLLLRAAIVGFCAGLTGCASAWETVTSRDFKEQPFHTLFGEKPDPLYVLRTSPEGSERAMAMSRLEEPLQIGGSQADQDEVVDHILGPAATSDPSPVVRAAAIDALGRFRDERAMRHLIAAYHQADGDHGNGSPVKPKIRLASANDAKAQNSPLADGLGLHGPSGFPTEVSATLRSKVVAGLARTGRPEAVEFLAEVATASHTETATDRDTRMAAVRALGTMRTKESVHALATVFAAEQVKDVAIAGRAHEGLMALTGKDLPPDPAEWNQVIQAGFELAPPSSSLDRMFSRSP